MDFNEFINKPRSQIGLRMLAGNRWDQNVGSAFGQAALGTQEEQFRQQDEVLRRKLVEAQIQRMQGTESESPPLEIVVGPDGNPMYKPRREAAGMQPYLEPKGTAGADTGMIQEWKASGEPDYFKFLQKRSEMVNPRQAAPEPLVVVQTPNGPMYVPRSQAAGMPPSAAREAPSEGERGAANYFGRMDAAEKLLGDYVPSTMDYIAADRMMKGGPTTGAVANMALSAQGQKYYQAASDWVRAKLRKESGAVIAPEEMAQEIKTYFPMPGDSPGVIAQKKQARQQAMGGMKDMGGRAMTNAQSPAAPTDSNVIDFSALPRAAK